MLEEGNSEPSEEEKEPESLRKKWESEDTADQRGEKTFIACPHCGQLIETKSFFCLYCGQRVFSDSGLLGKINHAMTRPKFQLAVFILIAAFILLWILF